MTMLPRLVGLPMNSFGSRPLEQPHLTCMWHEFRTHQFTEFEVVAEACVRAMDLGMSVLYPIPGENVEDSKDIKFE